MLVLALANLTHRKVRTSLSVLAVAIAVTLLLVLVGLSDGTLRDVAGRMESVDAEIVVRDRHFDLGSMSGGKLWEKEIGQIAELHVDGERAVERVMPVFLGRMKAAGLSQNVFGVKPGDFVHFSGSRRMLAGEVFEDCESPEAAMELLAGRAGRADGAGGVMQLVVDKRLSDAGGLELGDTIEYGDTPARVVGIVETGVAGRVFGPINLLRAANGVNVRTAHMFFVKGRKGLATDQLRQLCEQIEQATKRQATLVANYGQVLAENFRNLTIFMRLVSVIALVICFLFIVVTMYTIVLERGREIAIMQSLGATAAIILRQTIQESVLICSAGTAIGIGLAYAARWLIETVQPLMNVDIQGAWLLVAVAVGLVGGVASAMLPGYIALRNDPAEVLSLE